MRGFNRENLVFKPNIGDFGAYFSGIRAFAFSPFVPLRNNGKIRRLATLSGNMPPMDVAGVIWMTVFGIVIGAAVLAGGIFIYRFIYALIKGTPTDD